jgi:formamidopyrimidine-DNA glycosylase
VVVFPAVPELPEVETIRRSLAPKLVGHRAIRVEAANVRLRHDLSERDWRRGVVGSRLLALQRRGKYLLFHFETAVAVVHLGMSGRLLLAGPDTARCPHTHLVVHFDHGLELRYVDPRRFGVALVLDLGAVGEFASLASLGCDPLEDGLEEALCVAAGRSRAPIRNLLLDQSVIAGLGNIYATEALARAAIHPLRRSNAISRRRLLSLAAAVRAVLRDALAAGGTTLADGGFVDSAGNSGYFAVELQVYGREGLPCRRCGAAVRRRVAAGRSVFYCPHCQR